MPEIVVMPSENKEETSFSRCALVKGYPIVIKNSDNPDTKYGVKFDSPYFYWYTDEDREKQLCDYMEETYGIARDVTLRAVKMSADAQKEYDKKLKAAGRAVLDEVTKNDGFAVVLAGRPYHNDPLVNHELPELLVGMVVAFVFGIIALKWLMNFVQKGKFQHFAWYVWALGIFGLIFI
jgi:predicted nucleotide-binding protein (sugar kinase/HSP70/actin superfamily)